MYTCDNCNKVFSVKKSLLYHVKNKVCLKKKTSFHCIFCNNYYKNKYTLLRHLNNKHPIKSKTLINDKNEIIIEKEKEYKCEKCNKKFTKQSNLKRHIEKYCKISTMNITNINTYNNININININNFGNENISKLTKAEILECINRCYSSIPELFKKIHIDIPENRNLYLSSMKDTYLYLYKNNKWELDDSNKILNCIKNNKMNIIEKYFNENIDKFADHKKRNINKMINNYNNGIENKNCDKKIKMILISNRDILKKSYKKN